MIITSIWTGSSVVPPKCNCNSTFTAEIVRSYINYMRNEREPYKGVLNREIPIKGLTPNTINVRLRTLRAMCRFWTNEGYIHVNPMEKVNLIKTDSVDDLIGFTDKELRQLFGVLDLRQYSCFPDRINTVCCYYSL